MKLSETIQLILNGLVAGTLAHWLELKVPMESVSEEAWHYLMLILFAFVAAVISKLRLGKGSFSTALFVGLGVFVAAVAKIAMDLMHYPTSHNLLPFELLFKLVLTGTSTLAGSWSGQLFRYLRAKW